MAEQQRDDDQEHLGGPTPGVDRGAGMTSARGDTDGPTTTGATTTGQGSTGTAQPPGDPAEEEPAAGRPVHATDAFGAQEGAVGDTPAPAQGDPEVRAEDGDHEARRLPPDGA